MGPRFTRGLCQDEIEQTATNYTWFQWGRALRADCVDQVMRVINRFANAFQWGRALRADCVRTAPRTPTSLRTRFQWGRALRADCVPAFLPPSDSLMSCFNGAALYARIVSTDDNGSTVTATIKFQWGRALRADCVTPQIRKEQIMNEMFQWGRALRADCVLALTLTTHRRARWFQWGRALRADCVRCYASP